MGIWPNYFSMYPPLVNHAFYTILPSFPPSSLPFTSTGRIPCLLFIFFLCFQLFSIFSSFSSSSLSSLPCVPSTQPFFCMKFQYNPAVGSLHSFFLFFVQLSACIQAFRQACIYFMARKRHPFWPGSLYIHTHIHAHFLVCFEMLLWLCTKGSWTCKMLYFWVGLSCFSMLGIWPTFTISQEQLQWGKETCLRKVIFQISRTRVGPPLQCVWNIVIDWEEVFLFSSDWLTDWLSETAYY